MPNFTPKDGVHGGEIETRDRVDGLDLGHGIQLVHDPSMGEGKTASMAKGLFLCHQGKLLAGESAGFGLPVFKAARQTFFPSDRGTRRIGPNTMEKVFVLNLVLVWRIFGHRVRHRASAINEKLVFQYMKRPGLQRLLLASKNLLRHLLRTSSMMIPGPDVGSCLITYEATEGALAVHVDGSLFSRPGQLILLNEAEGTSFSRLWVGDHVKEGAEIPGWHTVPLDAVLESPSTGLGFSISLIADGRSDSYALAVGREIAHDLNWAGFALMVDRSTFSYRAGFHTINSL